MTCSTSEGNTEQILRDGAEIALGPWSTFSSKTNCEHELLQRRKQDVKLVELVYVIIRRTTGRTDRARTTTTGRTDRERTEDGRRRDGQRTTKAKTVTTKTMATTGRTDRGQTTTGRTDGERTATTMTTTATDRTARTDAAYSSKVSSTTLGPIF